MIAWMIEDVLVEAGFRSVAIAADGERALAAAALRRPGLIVSDVNLGPGADGIDTALRIRAESSVPLIFVTAYSDAALRARLAAELPGAQLLRKPVDPAALLRAVMRALGD